jgi:hypothetical protein
MMLSATDVKNHLNTTSPGTKFYAGAIDKNSTQCVGVYPRGRKAFSIAAGGIANTSHWYLPLTLLVHWTEDSEQCEQKATSLYEYFITAENVVINGFRIIHFDLSDSCPVDLNRDDRNICEMVIRLNVIYENHISQING